MTESLFCDVKFSHYRLPTHAHSRTHPLPFFDHSVRDFFILDAFFILFEAV